MSLISKIKKMFSRPLYLGVGLLALHQRAEASEAGQTIESFVELKGADLMTPGQSGIQIVRLPDGAALRVEQEDMLVRGNVIFLKTELAAAAGIPATGLGQLLEMTEANHTHSTASHGHFGTVASTMGTVAGTMVVASAMDDLSAELVSYSTTTLDAINDDDPEEALDAEEDDEAEEEETIAPATTNTAPTFDAAPNGGEASESAEEGTAVGVTVQATDSEGDTLTYTIAEQQAPGAFSVEPSTGIIRVADSSQIDFETNETLDLTIAVTDPNGGRAEQTVTITVLDDPSDTLQTTATNVVAHSTFSSGALILSESSDGTTYFGHAGIIEGVDEGDARSAQIELFNAPSAYLNRYSPIFGLDGNIPPIDLFSSLFTALEEINTGEMAGGWITLTSSSESGDNTMLLETSSTDFSGAITLQSPSRVKKVDQGLAGSPDATYTLNDGTVTQGEPDTFTQTSTVFDVGMGDIWHFADLTGDGRAEFILKKAGVGEADVYENLGAAFDTTPMAETIFTGLNLDELAGGRALDISVREHYADDRLNVILLGETDTYLYELT